MSAIAGVVDLTGQPVSREILTSMASALAHRGPASLWCCGQVGMASAGWHAWPAPRGQDRPVAYEVEGLLLVADARIDNREDLGATLGLGRHVRATDAELILRAYERWGTECSDRLIGDFAFAIWDGRNRSVFCARDPMGVRPLYYHLSGRLFAFASEIKALVQVPQVPRRLDEERITDFLASAVVDRTSTMYAGIARLPAAHAMCVTRTVTKCTEYWRPDPDHEVRLSSDDEYAEAFRELFTESVRARVGHGSPIGATLSGGLDSSAVVCTARQILGACSAAELQSFSLVFPGLGDAALRVIDERVYIEHVLRSGAVRAHAVRGDEMSPLGDIDRMLWHLDEPFAAPNLYLHWGLYGASQRAGIRVLLDGFDGDATVSHGFGRFDSLLGAGQWEIFEAEVRALAAHRRATPRSIIAHVGLPRLSRLAEQHRFFEWFTTARELSRRFGGLHRDILVQHGLRAMMPPLIANAWRALRTGRGPQWSPETSILRPELAKRVGERAESNERHTRGDENERSMHARGIADPLYQLTLETADKCARAFGVEPSYPFFDRRLIDFCVGVPPEQKFSGGWPRLIFRRAMEGVLPPEVQWRATKGNLSPNFHKRLREVDRPLIESVLADSRILDRWIDPRALDRVARRYFASPDRWGDPDGHVLFRTAVLGQWLSRSPLAKEGSTPTFDSPATAA